MVGTQIVEFNVTSNGIIIDSELKEAYWGSTLKNSQMTGDFPVLPPGSTAISWSGGTVTEVVIWPHWREK